MSANYDLMNLYAPSNPEESGKYFGLSLAVHVAMVIGSLFVVVPAMDNLKKEIITIELQSEEKMTPPPVVKKLADPHGAKTVATKGAERVFAPAPSAPLDSELAPVIAGPVAKLKTSRAKAAQVKTHTGAGHKAVAKTAVSRAGIPETLEDIPAPDLDAEGVDVAQVGNLGENEFENEFKKVDHANDAAIRAQQAEFDEEAKQVADEKEAALRAIEEENIVKAKAMEDALVATRNKNAAAIAQMKATEKAAAAKAARESELAAAEAAAAAKNRGTGAHAASAGKGNGATGDEEQASNQAAGEPNGVRSLDQLRQLPGNPKPQYSYEERLRRQFGDVVFYAFITNQGQPTQFKLIQSTGHRSLDGKTLAALKKWKFYPGQQGWVEIPFKWDLTGGVQEMPTSLRRVGSR